MLTHFLCFAEPRNKATTLASPSCFQGADPSNKGIGLVEAVHTSGVRLCCKEHGRAGCSWTSPVRYMSLQGWGLVAIPHTQDHSRKDQEWKDLHWEWKKAFPNTCLICPAPKSHTHPCPLPLLLPCVTGAVCCSATSPSLSIITAPLMGAITFLQPFAFSSR